MATAEPGGRIVACRSGSPEVRRVVNTVVPPHLAPERASAAIQRVGGDVGAARRLDRAARAGIVPVDGLDHRWEVKGSIKMYLVVGHEQQRFEWRATAGRETCDR